MNAKSVLRWLMLAIVLGSVAVFVWRGPDAANGAANGATGENAPPPDASAAAVVATYFTTDVRCDSCRTIERLSRQAIEEGFADEVARGEVVYRVLNTDRDENRHFLDDYEIGNKTVIVSHLVDGKGDRVEQPAGRVAAARRAGSVLGLCARAGEAVSGQGLKRDGRRSRGHR